MTWVLSETSRRIEEEIAEKRPLRWGTTRLIAAILLLMSMLSVLPLVAHLLVPYVGKVLCGILLFMGSCVVLSLAHKLARHGEWDLKRGLEKWGQHTRIGFTSVWMLRNGGGLDLRIDPRNRRETDRDTGKWVLDVPLGGPNPEPAILQARTNNPIEGLTVVRVIWGEGPIKKVIVRDRSGNRVAFEPEDLLATLENEDGWDDDRRLEWIVGKLARDSKELRVRNRQYQNAEERVDALQGEVYQLRNRQDGLNDEVAQLKKQAKGRLDYLVDTTKRYWRGSVLLHETMCFLDGIRGTLINAARLQQRAPKEVAQMRDELLTWNTKLRIKMDHAEEATPNVMLIAELPKS